MNNKKRYFRINFFIIILIVFTLGISASSIQADQTDIDQTDVDEAAQVSFAQADQHEIDQANAAQANQTNAIPEIEERDGVLWAGEAWLQETEGLKIAYYTGTPQEMGIQQGVFFGRDPELLEIFAAMQPGGEADSLVEKLGGLFKNLYARFRFYPNFKRHTPDQYLAEMEGFVWGASEGETKDYYDVMMGNALQDLSIAGPACSSFAAWGEATADGRMYVGRNLDHAGFLDFAPHQYLGIYVPDSGYSFAVHNYPAFIGTMSGMNEKGIVIAQNYSMAVQEEITIDGMPFMFMLRHVLQEAASLEEALAIIEETPRTIGLNLMLADAGSGEAVVVELTARRMVVRRAEDYIYTSNMFQDPAMQEFQAPGWMASALRDRRFARLGEELRGAIDLEESRNILRDKLAGAAKEGFYAGINTEVNLASMVFLPEEGEIWLGAVEKGGLAPYAADGPFVGYNLARAWETGQPQEVAGVLPATSREGWEKYWFKVRDAARLVDLMENEKALALIAEVLEVYPEAAVPQLLAGRLHNRLDDYQKGLSYLEKFIEQREHPEPYNLIQAYFWAGLAHDQLGDREAAKANYQLALNVELEDMPGGKDAILSLSQEGIEHGLVVKNGRVQVRESGG